MEKIGCVLWSVAILVLTLLECSSATLSPSGVNYEGKFLFVWLLHLCLFCSHLGKKRREDLKKKPCGSQSMVMRLNLYVFSFL